MNRSLFNLNKIPTSTIFVEEFNKSKHIQYAKDIMDFDEELTKSQSQFNPAIFDDEDSLGKISYEKYIQLLLDNNWRLFVILLDDKCIGYIHTTLGKYKNSIYIGSFIITNKYSNRGYGREAMRQFEQLVKNQHDLMILNVAIKNKNAIHLYEKVGFKPHHITMSKKL